MKRYPSCILASCCIPWDESWTFMEGLFREEVRLVAAHTPNVYIMGTAGEGYAVSGRQFEQVVRVFAEEMRKAGGEPMVGLISLSTAEVVDRIELCREMGIRDFQLSLPSWGALTERETEEFFRFVCGSHPDCRFLHYNLERSKRIVSPEEYARLARLVPNLVAAKITTDSIRTIGRLMEEAGELQQFFTDLSFPHAAALGECGLLIAMASGNWSTARRYFDLARTGKLEEALRCQRRLVSVNTALRSLVLPHAHMDGAFDKMYVKLHQPEFPLRLYPPYATVPEDAFRAFSSLLEKEFPEWHPGTREE